MAAKKANTKADEAAKAEAAKKADEAAKAGEGADTEDDAEPDGDTVTRTLKRRLKISPNGHDLVVYEAGRVKIKAEHLEQLEKSYPDDISAK